MNEHAKAVRDMQKYIEAHIDEVITPAQLAEVSLFSPWYASRLFIQYIGMTPARYIRRLKLSRSALRLRDQKCRVIDIAMDMGFGSVDGYQRAFRAEFGSIPRSMLHTPYRYRCLSPPSQKLMKRGNISWKTQEISLSQKRPDQHVRSSSSVA